MKEVSLVSWRSSPDTEGMSTSRPHARRHRATLRRFLRRHDDRPSFEPNTSPSEVAVRSINAVHLLHR